MHHGIRIVSQLMMVLFPAALSAADSGAATRSPTPGSFWVYIGTYTGDKSKSKGVYLSKLDVATGALSAPQLAGAAQNPSFLALTPDGRYLYTSDEFGNFPPAGSAISAFAIENDGMLKHLNDQPLAGGPCYVATSKSGHVVLAADYGNGTIASFTAGNDGALSAPVQIERHKAAAGDPPHKEGPHAHCFDFDPSGRFALSCDLGLDKVFVYHIDDATGRFAAADPPAAAVEAGSGPRHLAFGPDGKFVYVINELASTITTFSYDAGKGSLAMIETVLTLPPGYKGKCSCAEIVVHPSGRFLYGSNRGHDSIAIFRIDAGSGKLTPAGHTPSGGKNPRCFGIDPSGKWLVAANQNSDNLVVFRIDPQSGSLTPAGAPIDLDAPVCVKFMEPRR